MPYTNHIKFSKTKISTRRFWAMSDHLQEIFPLSILFFSRLYVLRIKCTYEYKYMSSHINININQMLLVTIHFDIDIDIVAKFGAHATLKVNFFFSQCRCQRCSFNAWQPH